MPRTVDLFEIFISCPSDMRADRHVVEETISEINLAQGAQSYFIKPLQWERDALPMIRAHAQDAINDQILHRADVICALIGSRIGSPTRDYSSGTIEEIIRFIDRNAGRLGGYEVQIYFKRERIDPLTADLEQIAAVRKFREEISTRGVFFKDYSEPHKLQSYIRRGILACVDHWHSLNGSTASSTDGALSQPSAAELAESNVVDDDDDGYFDLSETFNQRMDSVNRKMVLIGEAMQTMAQRLNAVRGVMEATNGVGISIKDLFVEASTAVDDATSSISANSNQLQHELNEALNALRKGIELSAEIHGPSPQQVVTMREGLEQAISSAEGAYVEMLDFYQTIISLPNLSKLFRKSCRRLSTSVKEVLEFIENSILEMKSLKQDLDWMAPG